VEIPSWNVLLLLLSLLALILLIINLSLLEPLPELREPPEVPQFLLINHLTKTLFVVLIDGIVLTFLKDPMLNHALIVLAVTLEMEVIACGTLIPTLDLVEETLTALILVNVTLPLTVVTPTTLFVPSIHVVVLEEFVPQFALNK